MNVNTVSNISRGFNFVKHSARPDRVTTLVNLWCFMAMLSVAHMKESRETEWSFSFPLSLSLPFQYRTNSVPIMKSPKPTVSQGLTESTTKRPLIYGIQDDNGTDIQNFQLDLTPPPDVVFRTLPGTSEGMNVLGIVIFSATMGKKQIHIHYRKQHKQRQRLLNFQKVQPSV